jgi:hypothetical protein
LGEFDAQQLVEDLHGQLLILLTLLEHGIERRERRLELQLVELVADPLVTHRAAHATPWTSRSYASRVPV